MQTVQLAEGPEAVEICGFTAVASVGIWNLEFGLVGVQLMGFGGQGPGTGVGLSLLVQNLGLPLPMLNRGL